MTLAWKNRRCVLALAGLYALAACATAPETTLAPTAALSSNADEVAQSSAAAAAVEADTAAAAVEPGTAASPAATPVEPGATASRSREAASQRTTPPPTLSDHSAPNLYRCRHRGSEGERWNVIELSPKLAKLCRRHPEMGPCQYQREICRRAGGQVIDEQGREITRQLESEYDRRVLRLKFKS